jgi:AcrR family transcriptional regulator
MRMQPKRKPIDRKARREEFFAAAYRMIKNHGIAGVTARSVAAEAGFTTGALVHYVKSMDELLVSSSEYAARDVRAKMIEAEGLADPVEALRQVLYLALPTDPDKRGNWNFFLGFWERSVHNAAVRKVTHQRYTEWLKRVTRLLRAIKRAGRMADDVDIGVAARAAMALTDGIAIQVMRSGKPPSAMQQRKIVDAYIEKWLT